MKLYFFLFALFLVSSIPCFGQSSERSEGIVIPVATLGDVSETRRQILQNTLIETLSRFYRLVPQDKFIEVQEKVFQELDYDECTEDQCIIRIQDMLQVENFFVLQVIGEGDHTQISLKWVGLDDKIVKTFICQECDTFKLTNKVNSLTLELIKIIKNNNNSVNNNEGLTTNIPRNKNDVKKDILLNKTKNNDDDKIITLRTLFTTNVIEFSLNHKIGLGFLNQTENTEISESYKQYNHFNGIYVLYNFNDCYFCDSYNLVLISGYGSIDYTSPTNNRYEYNIESSIFLVGYQWYFEYDLSIVILGGIYFREYTRDNKSFKGPLEEEKYVYEDINNTEGFFPAILFGYSF